MPNALVFAKRRGQMVLFFLTSTLIIWNRSGQYMFCARSVSDLKRIRHPPNYAGNDPGLGAGAEPWLAGRSGKNKGLPFGVGGDASTV